ncbi:hypothetical protein CKO23_17730 [Thiocystis violacea]|nr:hypothetical protein [Thiocystis violacea]
MASKWLASRRDRVSERFWFRQTEDRRHRDGLQGAASGVTGKAHGAGVVLRRNLPHERIRCNAARHRADPALGPQRPSPDD